MFLFQDKSFEEYLISIEHELKEIKNLLILMTNVNLKDELVEQLIPQLIEKIGDNNENC